MSSFAVERDAPLPFWKRLRAIALYPLRGGALAMLVVLTVARLLGVIPLVGWLIVLLAWFAAYKYAFEILQATADGRDEAPEVGGAFDGGIVFRLFMMYVIFGLLVGVVLVLAGELAGLVALAAIAFLQPGCVMSLAMTGSLGQALNPATPLGIVSRIGWPYLAVFGLLFVIQATTLTAGSWVSRFVPGILGDVGVAAVSFWGLFAAFHLMGYLVYQYHGELGFEPATHANALPQRHAPDGQVLAEAGQLVHEGKLDAARDLLRAEIRTRAVGADVHDLYQRLLRQAGDNVAAVEHAGQYLHMLVMEKQERRALGLLRETLDIAPDFVPLRLEDGERLAGVARMSGQGQLALDTWQALSRARPRHANAARWAFDAGMVAAERLGRDDEARALLGQALDRCDDDALRPKIESALKALRATAAS